MKNKLIICDIDNTLLFTDKLNSKSYIEAAKKLNICLPESVINVPRITASLISRHINNIDDATLDALQKEKLNYFLNHLEEIEINNKLLNEINKKSNYLCLWTASNKQRALAECKALGIIFEKIIFFNKNTADTETLNRIFSAIVVKYKVNNADIEVYDDDEKFLKKVKELRYKTILIRSNKPFSG